METKFMGEAEDWAKTGCTIYGAVLLFAIVLLCLIFGTLYAFDII
jgi:hypothetical protein